MPTGGASGESAASGCSGSAGRKSNATSHISSIRAAWTGYACAASGNVHKKLLIQAAACNLALLMRSMYGAGKPRAAHDQAIEAIFAILALIKAIASLPEPWGATAGNSPRQSHRFAHR